MLAAAPDRDQALELFRLTLELIQSNQGAEISGVLREYFDRVISEAKKLTNDPTNISPDTLPESIELALRMNIYTRLHQGMADINDINAVSPEIAGQLLENMENQPVYPDQFAFAS